MKYRLWSWTILIIADFSQYNMLSRDTLIIEKYLNSPGTLMRSHSLGTW